MRAKISIDKEYVDRGRGRRIYGSFIEHLGRAVYGGIYEPGHPKADATASGATSSTSSASSGCPSCATRAATSSPASDWEDSVGPIDKTASQARPRLELRRAQRLRPRRVRRAGPRPPTPRPCSRSTSGPAASMRPATSSSTATIPAALLERPAQAARLRIPTASSSGASGTRWTAPGRSGTRPPTNTAALAYETAQAIKLFDPGLELVACGSSNDRDAHLPALGGDRPGPLLRLGRLSLPPQLLQ